MHPEQTETQQVSIGGSSTIPKIQLKSHLLQEISYFSEAEFLFFTTLLFALQPLVQAFPEILTVM